MIRPDVRDPPERRPREWKNAGAWLVLRVLMLQILVGTVAALLMVAFAPRLLLLEPSVVQGSQAMTRGAALFGLGYALGATAILMFPLRRVLRSIAVATSDVEPGGLLELYALPTRLVLLDAFGALAMATATLVRPIRPESNDLYTQAELVLLAMTLMSVAALPLYVMVRASVARVIEAVPVHIARDAIDLLEPAGKDFRRVRPRLLVAVVAPVAFVALGASLLVHAHIRAFDTTSRQNDASDVVRAVLEPLDAEALGRNEARAAAADYGLAVDLDRAGASHAFTRSDDGTTTLTEPLEDGRAVVRFRTARLSPDTGIYALLALLATALAGLLGSRIVAAFGDDVALATREVRATGVADVLLGTRVPRAARFSSVASLTFRIDALGGVFREFASTQQRAIDARAAAERMRAMFLASMSHDLKAPLNAVLGFAELVAREPLTEGQRESVTIIAQRGRELLYLINTILDAARAEAGELDIVPEPTRVDDILTASILEARELLGGSDVRIVGEIQPGASRVFVDPTRASQALTAIVLVAVRFADRGIVHVRASLAAEGERLRIDVESTGRGLPQPERDKIFEAFKYPDRARRHGSLGLGPSLARSIVELSQGSIEVEATEHGSTVFRVWLPTERRAARAGDGWRVEGPWDRA